MISAGWVGRLRATMLAGLVVTVPAVVTVLALGWVFRRVDSLLGPLIARWVGHSVPGLGLLATLLLVLLVGVIATNYVGRRAIALVERFFVALPFVRRIYGASKEVVQSATLTRGPSFREVVMVEYPRAGLSAYGFVMSYVTVHAAGSTQRLANVFIPTPPVPTSGILSVVPVAELRYLDVSIEDAVKLILSAGLASPAELRVRPPGPTGPPDVEPDG